MLAEFSQESDRPEAPLASAPSVTNHTLAPRRARWYALETPIAPPPMTATLGCVWLLMLLTSIEALGLQQDQRQHSFKGPTPDILCRHRCPAPQPIAVQVTARPTDLGSSCPTDFGRGERGFWRWRMRPNRHRSTPSRGDHRGRRASAGYVDAGCPFGLTTSQVPPNSVTLWHSTWYMPSCA